MPNYTQGAAALYPGLCSSALTARAGQYIFCEYPNSEVHVGDGHAESACWSNKSKHRGERDGKGNEDGRMILF